MKTVLKFLGFTLALLATIAVSASVYIGWLFDPNDYRDLIEATVEDRTGRDFSIEGDLSLSFFPPLGIETGGLTLGNAVDFGDEPFATADRAVLRAKIWPLLFRRVELGNFEIEGLRLNLARDSSNTGNWEDLLSSSEPAEITVSPTIGNGDNRLRDLEIEGVIVSDSLIFWHEDTTEVRYIVSELSLETGPILIGQPVRADMDFQLVSVEPQFTAQIDTSVIVLVNPASSRYLAEDLRIGFYLEDGRHEERAAGSFESTISLNSEEMILTLTESQLEASLRNPPIGPESLQVGATWESSELDLRRGIASVFGLDTNTNGILANWEVTGRNFIEAPALAGQVEIVDEPLGAAFDILGLSVDEGQITNSLGDFEFSAGFDVQPLSRQIGLSEVMLTALGMELTGELTLNANGNGSGRIDLPRFDPRDLLSLFPTETYLGIAVENVDSLELSVEFALDGERQQAAFRNVRAGLADISITGDFDHFRAERRVEGSIETNEIEPDLVASLLPELLPAVLSPERLDTLRLNSEFAFDTVTDELSLTDFDANAFGLHATGNLAVSELRSGAPHWTGNLHVNRFDLRNLLARFDFSPQPTQDPSVFGSAVIDTRLDVTSDGGNFRAITLQLDDSTISGDVSIMNFSDPEYEFELAVDRLDVDRYLPPGSSNTMAPSSAAERVTELPTGAMHSLALQGQLSIDALRIGGLDLEAVATNVTVSSGLGIIDSATANLYGGDFEGGVRFDARGGIPELALEGTAVNLQLDPLLTAIRDESNLSGTGNFDIELSGIGTTFVDALASTAGRIDFSMREGIVRGFNLGHELCTIYNRLETAPGPAGTALQFTSYELLRGSAVVTDGIARTGDLQASTSYMETIGRGQLDLTNRDVNFDLIATLTGSIEIDRCETMDPLIGDSLPLRLTGNFAEPEIRPDFGEILRNRARESIEERLREELLDRLLN